MIDIRATFYLLNILAGMGESAVAREINCFITGAGLGLPNDVEERNTGMIEGVTLPDLNVGNVSAADDTVV